MKPIDAIMTQEELIRDRQNTVVDLAGQSVAAQATATIYWNQKTRQVYVDASGLP